jgi:predicted peroxiredoxin
MQWRGSDEEFCSAQFATSHVHFKMENKTRYFFLKIGKSIIQKVIKSRLQTGFQISPKSKEAIPTSQVEIASLKILSIQ